MIGTEIRLARHAAGLRQKDVARASGVSRSWVSRIERGVVEEVGVRLLSVVSAVVGLDLSMRAYQGGQPLRDEGHRQALARARGLLPEGTPWQTEVPFPGPGDQRAWDAMARLWRLHVGFEVEMRPSDLQALQRRLGLKRRDGGVDRMVLVLADTRHNRHFLRLAADSLRPAFPLQGAAAMAALGADTDPGCDLLVLV